MGENKYGWKISVEKYERGTFLLGLNFNTNDIYSESERETYICIYLGKIVLVIGRFH